MAKLDPSLPPASIFPTMQLHVLAAVYSQAIRPLFRYLLRIVLYRGVLSLGLFLVLYNLAEYKFTNLYFALGIVWKPAFPLSWRLLFLLLFIVPVLASIHLICLSLRLAVLCYRWWRHNSGSRPSRSQGYMMLSRSASDSLEEDAVDDRGFDQVDVEDNVDPSSVETAYQQPAFPLCLLLWCVLWSVVLCTSLWLLLHYRHPGDSRYLPLIEQANARPAREGYGNKEKIFIAAMFSNNEQVIPYWSDSFIKAIRYLGEDNVFVSIVESGSWDRSPALLRQFDERLDAMNVSRRILTEDKAIAKPDSMDGNNRINFLSALRNRALEPLVENGGYDKVLFSNDIYIEAETILELVKTADGEYDMVCGLDFGHWGLYDLWVIRDKQGRLPSSIWPYFFDQEDYEAMQSEAPVPVFACWNGIVVFDADPVLPVHLRSNKTLSTEALPYALPATHPAAKNATLQGPSPALTPPIGFRAGVDGECFSSESFLLPYDLRRLFNLKRILVNPRVIVGYDWRFYVYFKWFMRHPVLKWWIEKMYDGAWMQKDIMVVGDAKHLWSWDGGDCHPWW